MAPPCAACLLALAGCAAVPSASVAPALPDDAACPDVRQLQAAHLWGSWVFELPDAGLRGTMTLRQHPEFGDSLRGEIRYRAADGGAQGAGAVAALHGRSAIASGDVEGGEIHLDDSLDGKSLHAFWSGALVPQACGGEMRGTWQTAADGRGSAQSAFILRRQPQ